ncbi:MmgE/PrpD family protein [Chloroflexota bacterium]
MAINYLFDCHRSFHNKSFSLKPLVNLVKEWGGKEESSIIVYGGKVPAPDAALANCTMARALDFDDVRLATAEPPRRAGGHLSATTVPGSFVLAEYSGKPVNGKSFILANALGSDLHCRLRQAASSEFFEGWTETTAPFGIVATGGKLLGFDEETMLNGMGVAYSQCSFNAQAYLDGALAVRLQQGLGARAGVLAVALAERGFTGARNVLQGKYGFYNMFARGKWEQADLLDELGERFEVDNISVKAYPCCAGTHSSIYGVLEIVKEHDIKSQEIDEITVNTTSYGYNLLAYSEEGDTKHNPRTIVDAQFSIPYTVATAAVKRKVFLDDFSQEAIKNPDVLQIAQKVKVIADPELDKLVAANKGEPPVRIAMKTKDGACYTREVQYVKGHPKNAMTMAECIQKFKDCTRFSTKPLPQKNINTVIQMTEALEEIDDVTEIVKLLSL